MPIIVNCPTCSEQVVFSPESTFRPFCSERCRLIDLGQWADEQHRIVGKVDDSSVSELDIEDIEALLANQPQDFFKS